VCEPGVQLYKSCHEEELGQSPHPAAALRLLLEPPEVSAHSSMVALGTVEALAGWTPASSRPGHLFSTCPNKPPPPPSGPRAQPGW